MLCCYETVKLGALGHTWHDTMPNYSLPQSYFGPEMSLLPLFIFQMNIMQTVFYFYPDLVSARTEHTGERGLDS